jgi:hypothetical protein
MLNVLFGLISALLLDVILTSGLSNSLMRFLLGFKGERPALVVGIGWSQIDGTVLLRRWGLWGKRGSGAELRDTTSLLRVDGLRGASCRQSLMEWEEVLGRT